MCRWLAYSGSPVSLEDLLLKPKNSLVVQSKHSLMGATTLNGDGFGVGWYGARGTPGVYRSTEPAWNDRNLRELSAVATSDRVFAHVRASTGSAVQQTNCHPFRHGSWLWMHNGYLPDFHTVKRDLALADSSEGQSRSLFHSTDIATLRAHYPEAPLLDGLSEDARLVVSEPLGDLEGAWREVPESSCLVVRGGAEELLPFTPVPG